MKYRDLISQVVREDMPDLEQVRENCHRQAIPQKSIVRTLRWSVAAAAILLLVTSTAVFAATGGLEQFLARFNPNFGEFAIAPLNPAYAVDQDIRIEVVGAQQIDNVLLVYTIMQDISGENRITRHMSPDIEFYVDDERMSTGGSTDRLLRFDRSTNTSYRERLLLGRDDMPQADTIELVITRIDCFEHGGQVRRAFEGEWIIAINANDLGIQPIVWSDVQVGNLDIEYMSLSPFGIQLRGTHTYGMANFPIIQASVEFEGIRRNYRFSGSGAGIGDDFFSSFSFADSPIDLDRVTAVIINGKRIQILESGYVISPTL
ncbi:MAG: hypothetical protein FWB88_13025 [Defluviitaleaceae bacterium]|nr:hypothetical protein [Defluviitaleaceae bacterium]MCL2240820.1 hypothetical protein [Defluviitaleaceae bacterium]